MVKSGLVDDPRVSHFRLTAHLSIAFLILAAMFWLALDLLHPARRAGLPARGPLSGLRRHAWWLTGIAAYMVVTGGLVAGIRAGYAYNTFPLMNGRWIPPEIMMIDPWWKNFFYNMATVQFDHRLGAWALTFLTVLLWWRTRGADLPAPVRRALVALTVALLVQVSLGIGTLLTGVSVPLAAAHQGCAVLLFGAALALNHAFARADQA
jgi:cytochrome c oxidase assembly protein subunit 15